MKLTSEQLELAQGCATAEELVGKAEWAGMELSLEQAQKILDASEFAEIGEDDLGMIAGGGCGSDDSGSVDDDYKCPDCQRKKKGSDMYWYYIEGVLYCKPCAIKRKPELDHAYDI